LDYRLKVAVSMLFKKKSSMVAAVIAVAIAVLVIVINYVTFDGVGNAIIRDLVDYRFGHIQITDRDGDIERPDRELIGFLESTGMVEGATVRLSDVASINNTRTPVPVRVYGVPIVGVLPQEEEDAARLTDTVVQGTFLTSRDSIVLGASVADDLGARIGDPVMVKVTDESGNEQTKRFTVVGISKTAGGLGFDTSAIVHIETLRDLNGRDDSSSELIVRLYDPQDSDRVSRAFSTRYAGERFKIQTIEESAESILQGIRSGIAFINLVGYFGMLSSAFGIITIMMMIVTSKIREIGVMRAIGSSKTDVMMIFLLQGTIIGAMGAALGFLLGSSYALYAQNSDLSFGESLSLAVRYDPVFVANTALTGLVMGVVASIYPAWRTTKLEPAEATRY
jgi:lipoprotein-releasing system permease protein